MARVRKDFFGVAVSVDMTNPFVVGLIIRPVKLAR
jgi:hypothetical protein